MSNPSRHIHGQPPHIYGHAEHHAHDPNQSRHKVRNELIRQVRLMLGDGMIDIELDPDHYDLSVDLALSRIRQRSENAVEEDFYAIQFKADQDEYTLPGEIREVTKLYNRSYGYGSHSGVDFDPFAMAHSNTYFMKSNSVGGLATYDFVAQFRETVARLAATDIGFIWNPSTHKIKLLRRLHHEELLLAHVYLDRPDDELLTDVYLKSWARDYALAQCKKMIGEARSKFSTLPGAQGGVSLNGNEMKTEGQMDLDKLEEDLRNYVDGSAPLGFIIG
jgi:hypothetical protein